MAQKLPRWLRRLGRFAYGIVMLAIFLPCFFLVLMWALWVGVVLFMGADRLPALLSDPGEVLHVPLSIALCALAAAGAVAVAWLLRRRWQQERGRVRQAVLRHFGLPDDEQGLTEARRRVVAVVGCADCHPGLPRWLSPGGRGWMYFLADGLLLVSSEGAGVFVPMEQLRELALLEGRRHVLALRGAGKPRLLEVPRLYDFGVVLRILSERGILLRYQSHA
jgi:hypothetical protein